MDPTPSQLPHHRPHWDRENLPGLRLWSAGLPGCVANHLLFGPEAFPRPQLAQADGSLTRLLKSLQKARLLIIDDLGVAAVGPKQYRDLLEILDDRNGNGSTLITSQFPVEQWHEIIADATVADAILDRLVHNAYRLDLKGESLRKTKGTNLEAKKGEEP